eukprot:SAG31_NODE_2021_length_6647_cov_2.271839_8_plen_140_part_00
MLRWFVFQISRCPAYALIADSLNSNVEQGGNQNMICYDTKMKMFYYKDDKKSVYMGAKNCGTSLPNEWHQVAFTIDANDNGVLYIDAEPKATFKTTVRPQRDSHFSMGQEWDGDSFTNLRPSVCLLRPQRERHAAFRLL